MRILVAALLMTLSVSASANMIKFQVDCNDVSHYGALSFNVKIWDEQSVKIRIHGHGVPAILNRLGLSSEIDDNDLRLTLDRKLCQFSDKHPSAFSCYNASETPFTVEIFNNDNVRVGDLELTEMQMALFKETSVGFPTPGNSLQERKGHELRLTLKTAGDFRVFNGNHSYFYHGASECKTLGSRN